MGEENSKIQSMRKIKHATAGFKSVARYIHMYPLEFENGASMTTRNEMGISVLQPQ